MVPEIVDRRLGLVFPFTQSSAVLNRRYAFFLPPFTLLIYRLDFYVTFHFAPCFPLSKLIWVHFVTTDKHPLSSRIP